MSYEDLQYHIGHKIVLRDVRDWGTNRETGLEIRWSPAGITVSRYWTWTRPTKNMTNEESLASLVEKRP
jgi:hypothetical protein